MVTLESLETKIDMLIDENRRGREEICAIVGDHDKRLRAVETQQATLKERITNNNKILLVVQFVLSSISSLIGISFGPQ